MKRYKFLWVHYEGIKPVVVGHGAGEYKDSGCGACVKYVLVPKPRSRRKGKKR